MSDAWDADLYDEHHSFVADLAADLLDVLDPAPGDRVLDLGCGTGDHAAELRERGVDVVGLDRSAEQLGLAREKHPGLDLVRADARHSVLRSAFDGVLSNATLHWVHDPDAAVRTVHDALRPGGRFVAEFGGAGNVSAIQEATVAAVVAAGYPGPESPWYFPTLGEYAGRLEAAGFDVLRAETFPRPTPLEDGEAGLRNWLSMFGEGLLAPVPEGERGAVLAAVEDRLRGELYEDGTWHADYQRLRVVARKPEDGGLRPVRPEA